MNFADGPRQLLPRGNRVGCTEGKGFVCVQVPGSETWGKWWLFFFFFLMGLGETACLEEGRPHTILISAAFHLPPCGRCSGRSAAWPGATRAELRA